MVLLGTLVNGLCIIVGSLIGRFLSRIPDKMKSTVMQGISLVVMVLGLQMGFKSGNFLIVILSIVIGAVLGEWWELDGKLNSLGLWVESKMGASHKGNISQGFVTATLIFVIGAMAIIGALDSGIRGDHQVLFTKAVIDGFTALILTTTLGIGVLLSFVPVVLYQGLIAIFATQIDRIVPNELMDMFINEITATGGIMIFAIGLNLSGMIKIRVANLLPGILVCALIVTGLYFYHQYM
ncbi:DUF554 domain-containing protein [Bacillus sp. FJAT-49732]|uniref:DUF554 domain-containing protein n=1 Tax=Lederbergia citrisecunda TaxID=2833583 RepID=A0A942TTA2_9BACI|nr:DUF554 domain-containing protein [Lederbergia citrisecunda]MBS4201404.1 DUF554 domain-containing protein [Lederbergia citrisecunda]